MSVPQMWMWRMDAIKCILVPKLARYETLGLAEEDAKENVIEQVNLDVLPLWVAFNLLYADLAIAVDVTDGQPLRNVKQDVLFMMIDLGSSNCSGFYLDWISNSWIFYIQHIFNKFLLYSDIYMGVGWYFPAIPIFLHFPKYWWHTENSMSRKWS